MRKTKLIRLKKSTLSRLKRTIPKERNEYFSNYLDRAIKDLLKANTIWTVTT